MKSACRYRAGLLLVVIVIALWVTSCEVTQGILGEYEHPFVVTYLGTSFLALHLPIAFLKTWLLSLYKNRSSSSPQSISDDQSCVDSINIAVNTKEKNSTTSFPSPSSSQLDSGISIDTHHDPHLSRDQNVTTVDDEIPPSVENGDNKAVMSTSSLALLATCIAPIWFSTEYLSNAALARTTVASTTILVSTSGLFTLFIGAAMKVETLTTAKIVSVVISTAGIVMTTCGKTWAPNKSHSLTSLNGKHSLIGDLFALLSAMTYGLFTVLLKKHAGEGQRVDIQKLYGFIGLFTLLTLWWLAWPLTAMGLEPKLTVPHSAKMTEILIANCFVGSFLPDYLLALGIVWTTPLVSALGLSLTIPLAMLEDIFIHRHRYSVIYIIGSAQVFLGFLIANFSEWLLAKLN